MRNGWLNITYRVIGKVKLGGIYKFSKQGLPGTDFYYVIG